MAQLTVVLDANVFISQPNARNNITDFRIGIGAAQGYQDKKIPFSPGQTISFTAVNSLLIVVAENPFNITITKSTSVTLTNQNRFFATSGALDSFSITNPSDSGTNNIEIFTI